MSVFKNKSFSRASEQINLTQPTISSHIRAIENELGCKLFDRVGRTVIPTKEAHILFSHASRIAESIGEIKTELGLTKEGVKGELIIGASTIPGTYLIPSMASRFKNKHPSISFQVIIGDSKRITDMVSGNELLLGIVGARMDKGKIEYLPFINDELILVSHPKLLNRKIISLKELTAMPFLLREEGSGTRRTIERYFLEKGVNINDMNIVAVLGSTDSVKEAVKSRLGASIISRIAVAEQLKAGALIEMKIKGLSMKRSFYVITHKKRSLPGHYSAFLNYLMEFAV